MSETVAYRYDAERFCIGIDQFDRSMGTRVEVRLRQFPILRHTPKGFWIDVYGTPRFVRREGQRRYALLTEPEARDSFQARKKRQMQILRAQIEDVYKQIDALGRMP